MAKKVILKRKVNDEMVTFFPQTSADNVMYDEDTTVKEVIDSVLSEIKYLERVLSINSLYIVGDDGHTLLDDGKGTNLVAIASLIGNIDGDSEYEDEPDIPTPSPPTTPPSKPSVEPSNPETN